MRRILWTLTMLLAGVLLASPALAQPGVNTAGQPVVRAPSMTVTDTASAFTNAQLMGNAGQPVTGCIGRVETNAVRIGILGILSPSSVAGQIVYPGEIITITGMDNLRRFLVIRVTANATIKWMCTAATSQ